MTIIETHEYTILEYFIWPLEYGADEYNLTFTEIEQYIKFMGELDKVKKSLGAVSYHFDFYTGNGETHFSKCELCNLTGTVVDVKVHFLGN